jgi:DNA-binding NarL/FixJ family response regulator
MIRIVLSEAHPLLRQGLLAIMADSADLQVVAVAEVAPRTLALDARHRPDLHLIGATLPPTDGYAVARRLSRQRPEVGIVLVAAARSGELDHRGAAYQALVAGARGYVAGDGDAAEVLRAVRAVAAGEAYLAGPVLLTLIEEIRRLAAQQAALSLDHRRVLDLLRQGRSNAEIALACDTSVSTVKRRLHEMELAFGVHGRTQVALRGLATDGRLPIEPIGDQPH